MLPSSSLPSLALRCARLTAIVALTTLSAQAVRAAEPRRLTLDACLALAAAENPDAEQAALEVEAAQASKYGALGAFGPKVKLEGSYLRWDDELNLEFDLSGLGLPFPIEFPPTVIRERTTTSLTASVIQPVTSLWTIVEAYRLRSLGLDVATVKQEQSRREITFQVTEAFYRALQADALATIAAKSVEQIEAQVRRARAFLAQGMVGENDVLRAELGLAAARQRAIQATGGAALAKGRLATLLGLAVETPLELVADVCPITPTPLPDASTVAEASLTHRAELEELRLRAAQARGAKRLAISRLLPQVAAVGSYAYNTGTEFQPERAWYVGGVLSWDVWEWGSSYFGIDEASVRARQAEHAQGKVENLLQLEAHSALVTLTAATEALAVAERAVTQAEENFRLENKRYEAAASTTFDVLDAETLLTTARAQQQTARYDYLIARAALTRVSGL